MEWGARCEDLGWGCVGSWDEPPPNPAQPSHLGPSGRSPQPELPVLQGCAGADYPRCSASGSAAPSAAAALLCSLPSPGRCTGASLPAGEHGEAGLGWPLSQPSGDTVAVTPVLGDAAGVWRCRRKAWLDVGMEPELRAGDGRCGEGDEEQTNSRVSTSWPGHQQPPPRLRVGNVSATASVTLMWL